MRYEIMIDGIMSETLVGEAFPELERLPVPYRTILCGPVVDEAHLYGLLARFHHLGLRVVELRQTAAPSDRPRER